jgi:Rrf2 family protein
LSSDLFRKKVADKFVRFVGRPLFLPHKQDPVFSRACEYAIRASIHIAEQSMQGRKVGLKDVAKAIESPEAYTSKILQNLVRDNIVNSEKGPTGGFSMDELKLNEVQLSSIVLAIDGDAIYTQCGLGLRDCSEKRPCPVHSQFKFIRNELKKMLETTSIKSLALKLSEGSAFLKQ